MGGYRRVKIENSLEKRILINLITNTDFLKQIARLYRFEYFTSSYSAIIAEWCIDFFDTYGYAPNTEIQSIYTAKKNTLSEEDQNLISKLLLNLSELSDVISNNLEYLVNETVSFFKQRSLELSADKIKSALERQDLSTAENVVLNYKSIANISANWVNPFENNEFENVFAKKEEGFFKLPGELGAFLGDMHRGWVVALEGAYKRGKTWWLQEFGLMAAMDGLNVVFVSLEMKKEVMLDRMYRRICASIDSHKVPQEGYILVPCFDCKRNQHGTCDFSQRQNQTILAYEDEELPECTPDLDYTPCTFCMGTPDYEFATWWEVREDYKLHTKEEVVNDIQAFFGLYGHHFKFKEYPRFSANIRDIESDIQLLIDTDGFVPDVVIIDHADILKPESRNDAGIQKEDETWIALSQLAGKFNVLCVTATQITKEGQDAAEVDIQHTARWSGKLGHLDMLIGLNQTPEEKQKGILRINTILHRHEEFASNKHCAILQHLGIGQTHIDSYGAYTKE